MVNMEILMAIAVLIAFIAFDLAAWFLGVDSRDLTLNRSDRPARAI
jgi:hypothetical protein